MPASAAAASVPMSADCTKGTVLRIALRIDCQQLVSC
jgi:hypothetical protein